MTELVTCKGRYRAEEPIELSLHHAQDCVTGTVEIKVMRLDKVCDCFRVALDGPKTQIMLTPLEEGCYGVDACLLCGDKTVAHVSTAVNVGGCVVRYGFLSDFQPEDDTDVETMAKYHIDHVQFYDWSYRHDTLVPPEEEYADMMGKRNSLPVIRQKIKACHNHGMLTMAYGAVYAASKPFWDEHRAWGLYYAKDKPMVFIGTFYYMDIDGPWREHLFRQYVNAVEEVGFDGIHMDTYGEPKRALTVDGEIRNLEQGLPALIRDADRAMKKAGHTPHLIFNNVGAWPVEETCLQPQEAVYMELWPPMDRYHHLFAAVHRVQVKNKPIILAAYPAPFRTDTKERALYSELILSFAIALCGATQLFLGEQDAVVTQGYYADYTRLVPWQIEKIKAYQDFFVRYQDLLFDRSLRHVSLTHCGGDNMEYSCDTHYSLEGESDKLWLTFREDGDRKLIGLINLRGNDNRWNTGKNKPDPIRNITLYLLTLKPVSSIWFASPDDGVGSPKALPFDCVDTGYGMKLIVNLPQLDCCGLIWL